MAQTLTVNINTKKSKVLLTLIVWRLVSLYVLRANALADCRKIRLYGTMYKAGLRAWRAVLFHFHFKMDVNKFFLVVSIPSCLIQWNFYTIILQLGWMTKHFTKGGSGSKSRSS